MDFLVNFLLGLDMLWLWISLFSDPVMAVAQTPMFDSLSANVTVKEMNTAVLPCSIRNRNNHQVVWSNKHSTVLTYEDSRVTDDSRISVERPFIKDWNLHIRNVVYSDRGRYTCQLNTKPIKMKEVYLTVKVPAKILNSSSPDNVKVREGETVRLQCNVSGIPTPTVTWKSVSQNGKETNKSEFCTSKNIIGMNGEVLLIKNISRHCGGIYKCSASNGVVPAVSRLITVSVEFKPEVTLPTTRIGQIQGKETILECQVALNPQGGVVWRKNGEEIKNESGKYRILVYTESHITLSITLRIYFLEPSDYGHYACEAYNQLGKDSGLMELYEYVEPKVRTSTTAVIPVTLPHKTRIIPPPDRASPHHRHHHMNKNTGGNNQHYRHRSNSVVVKDGRENIPNYNPQDERFRSNEGKTRILFRDWMRTSSLSTVLSINE